MRMRPSRKGRRAPPPVLDGLLQGLSETVQAWPGVDASTHWHFSRDGQVDGADFHRDGGGLGHLHLGGELHLATSATLAPALVRAGLAQIMPWGGAGEWVTYRILGEDGLRHAEWLLRLGYDHLGGTPEAELLARVSGARRPA